MEHRLGRLESRPAAAALHGAAPNFGALLVVFKKTQLQLATDNGNRRIKKLLKRKDPSVARMRESNDAHERTMELVDRVLTKLGLKFRCVYRAQLRASMAVDKLVVCVGGDGTLLDASHKAIDSPILGVNSDTGNSIGFLCGGHAGNFAQLIRGALTGALVPTRVSRMTAAIDDVTLPYPVLNDVLVAHKNPAATSRVLVRYKNRVEDQRSSGIWACTAAGSSAAMASAGGDIFALDDRRMQVRAREPFTADGPAYRLAHVVVGASGHVTVTSKMREGRVYIDGPYEVRDLPTGARLTLRADGQPLWLFATEQMRSRRTLARNKTLRKRASGASP